MWTCTMCFKCSQLFSRFHPPEGWNVAPPHVGPRGLGDNCAERAWNRVLMMNVAKRQDYGLVKSGMDEFKVLFCSLFWMVLTLK